MPVGRRTGVATALACLGLAGFGGGFAFASPATITAESNKDSFTLDLFTQSAGRKSDFENPGSPNTRPHNVFAFGTGPDRGPLFYSETIQAGRTVQVRGTEYLTPGTYPFTCLLHSGMDSSLKVVGGTAVPRPRVIPRVPSQSLRTVRRTRRVKVTLKSRSEARSVRVGVRIGGRSVGSESVGSLATGKSRSLRVRLNRVGLKAVSKGRSVKLEANSVAEFGVTKRTSRVLRTGRNR